MSTLDADKRTFLFWREPDPLQLLTLQWAVTQAADKARFEEAFAEAQAQGVPENQIIHDALPQDRLAQVLSGYLKNKHGWMGTRAQRTGQVDLQDRFDDLPLSLRALILLDLREQMTGGLIRLPDDWSKVGLRLQVRKNNEGKNTLNVELRYSVHSEDGATEQRSIAPLGVVDEVTPPDEPASASAEEDEPTVPLQLEAKDTLSNAYSGFSDDGVNPALQSDPALAAPVSLAVKHLPLRELLKHLQKQSGVRFQLAPDAPGDKLITARVDKMPMSKMMGLLGRVYGVKWSKGQDATYTMRGNNQGQLHLLLLQLGNPDKYRYRLEFTFYSGHDIERAIVARAIVRQVGLAALQTDEGVPVSSLSRPLQERLRHALQDWGAEGDATLLYKANRFLVEQLQKKGLVLHFGTPPRTYHIPTTYLVSLLIRMKSLMVATSPTACTSPCKVMMVGS